MTKTTQPGKLSHEQLQAGQTRVRFLGRANISFLASMLSPALGPTQASYPMGTGDLPQGQCGQDVKLTSHLHLLLRPKKVGTIPPLPCILSWCGA